MLAYSLILMVKKVICTMMYNLMAAIPDAMGSNHEDSGFIIQAWGLSYNEQVWTCVIVHLQYSTVMGFVE